MKKYIILHYNIIILLMIFLTAIKRKINSMNYHYIHINYLLNRYKRKFKVMKTKYYDLKRNYDLFVINRGIFYFFVPYFLKIYFIC